ncbi:carboxylesterase family protein [Microbacterium sp.]|uniref:carboxylesterase family protein n=1 Tax=Microbacterium sp. TaxID=51671 RepID=UPI003C758194
MTPVETFWADAGDVVHTTRSGAITGLAKDDVAVFRGIPYAEAPVGPLRFAPPQRKSAAHEDGFDARAWGATPQRVAPGFAMPEPSVPGDDILNLNVFAPIGDLDAGPALPVLVWIHGGGYQAGSAASNWYDGRAFARAGIVVVSISYRLGFAGFGHVDGAVADRGVLDWIAALGWVQDHISSFGGDPGRVTIAGQSAGGGAVLALLSTRTADGLFHRAWALSGILESATPEQALQRGAAFAQALGAPGTNTADLAQFDDRTIELAGASLGTTPFLPQSGGALFPDGVVAGLGASAEIPLVLGATADEMAWEAGETPMSGADAGQFMAGLGIAAGDADEFLGSIPELGRTRSRILSEALFRAAVVDVQRRRPPENTWVYDYRWGPAPRRAALHCNEIPVFFGIADDPTAEVVLGGDIPEDVLGLHRDAVRFVHGHAPFARDPGTVRIYGDDIGDGYAVAAPLVRRWESRDR